MKLAYRYMLNQFLSTNLSLFGVLFLIVSMVFFIQLARMTASIEISLFDFFKLYSFMIPRILIFTLPLSFFIALTLTLYRLSRENESIVYFTLGFSPTQMGRFFLRIAGLLSAFCLLVLLVFIPIALVLQNNFIDYKKTQVKFNIKSGEFGQKFLDWLIFIEKENDGLYQNIIMYRPLKKLDEKELFIIAKEGILERNEQSLSFRLRQGSVYDFEQNQTWYAGHFDDIVINTLISDDIESRTLLEYYKGISTSPKRAQEFVIYTLIALFPLASTLFALSFGIVTYRYDKGLVYLSVFLVVGLYFGALSVFYQPPLLAISLIFCVTFGLSFWNFWRKILRRY